jgi:hypothetical protein
MVPEARARASAFDSAFVRDARAELAVGRLPLTGAPPVFAIRKNF